MFGIKHYQELLKYADGFSQAFYRNGIDISWVKQEEVQRMIDHVAKSIQNLQFLKMEYKIKIDDKNCK